LAASTTVTIVSSRATSDRLSPASSSKLNGQRLGNAGGFDHQGVEAPGFGQRAHLFQQVFAERAADAAVGHFHQRFLGLGERGLAAAHQVCVDVHLGHVVDDHGHAPPFAVGEDVVQQRRLAGPEEAGKDSDGQAGVGHRGTRS
jgi:hypothetical protein